MSGIMAGIGKLFEAFRLWESIPFISFYHIYFGQVWPKKFQILGGFGAHEDSIVPGFASFPHILPAIFIAQMKEYLPLMGSTDISSWAPIFSPPLQKI